MSQPEIPIGSFSRCCSASTAVLGAALVGALFAVGASAQDRVETERLSEPISIFDGRRLGAAVTMRDGQIGLDYSDNGGDVVLQWGRLFGFDGWRIVDSHSVPGSESQTLSSGGGHWFWAYELPDSDDGEVAEYLEHETAVDGLGGRPVALASGPNVMAIGVASGQVRIYRRIPIPSRGLFAWVPEETLTGPLFFQYGASLAFDATGNVLVLGAPGAGLSGANGYVEIWVHGSSGWSLYQTIDPPAMYGSQTSAAFGSDVAMAGPWLAVGARRADRETAGSPIVDTGQVLVYEANIIFTLEQSFFGLAGDELGTSVDLAESSDGSFLLVAGAPYADQVGGPVRGGVNADQGAVQTYRWSASSDEWSPAGRLLSSVGGFDDHLGLSVATDGRWIVAGAPDADLFADGVAYQDVGVALVFRSDHVFSDGFESGNSSAWSAAMP